MSDKREQESANLLSRMLNQNPLLLFIAIVAGAGGGGATINDFLKTDLTAEQLKQIAEYARPDPFTGRQGEELAQLAKDLNTETRRILRLDMCNRLRWLRNEMPPQQTRDRIVSLETALRELTTDYEPTSTAWGDLGPPCGEL